MNKLQKILEIPTETQIIEFKRLSGNKVVNKIIETVVAMANTDGGTIIIGIDDPDKTEKKGIDRVYGIEENLDLYDALGREIQKIIPPVFHIWEPELIDVDSIDKRVALLRIPKATEAFCSINNQVFVRQQKSNKKLSPTEIIKLSYAKGFIKADKELVNVDFDLLNTHYYREWKVSRGLANDSIEKSLFKTGLARKNEQGKIEPTRAAVLLFAEYPTNIMETKCTIRIYKYAGTIETFKETPNLIGKPETIEGPIVKLISKAQKYVLQQLESGIEIRLGFLTKYKIPERVIKEAITNAVIHRDYNIKRDIEIKMFEDRIEIRSPGLFPYNITKSNIGMVRADGYRNDLLVKHLREFSETPNLDRNEVVQAMRSEMQTHNLYPPLFLTYPTLEDSVEVLLLNEERPGEWEKVNGYLSNNKYIDNKTARDITGIVQTYEMSRFFSKWVEQGLIEIFNPENKAPRYTKYKLPNKDEI